MPAQGSRPAGRRGPVPPERDALGANLRRRREARGWTQSALARAAGLDQRYVGMLESGQRGRSAVSAWLLYRLAAALGVTMEDLLGLPPLGPDLADVLGLPPLRAREIAPEQSRTPEPGP